MLSGEIKNPRTDGISIRGCPFFIRGNWLQAGHCPRVHGSIVSGRFSDLRIVLPAEPSQQIMTVSGLISAFVPDYSGGPVPDLHGVPFTAHYEHLSESAYSYRTWNFCQDIFLFRYEILILFIKLWCWIDQF